MNFDSLCIFQQIYIGKSFSVEYNYAVLSLGNTIVDPRCVLEFTSPLFNQFDPHLIDHFSDVLRYQADFQADVSSHESFTAVTMFEKAFTLSLPVQYSVIVRNS